VFTKLQITKRRLILGSFYRHNFAFYNFVQGAAARDVDPRVRASRLGKGLSKPIGKSTRSVIDQLLLRLLGFLSLRGQLLVFGH